MSHSKHQYTRTIRFNLSGDNTAELVPDQSSESRDVVLLRLPGVYHQLLKAFQVAVFYESKNGDLKVKSSLQIKRSWLRQYARESFYELNDNERQISKYTAREAAFLPTILQDWLEENRDIEQELSAVLERPQADKARLSDVSVCIRRIKSRDCTGFVRELAKPGIMNDKHSDDRLAAFRDSMAQFDKLLDQVNLLVAPDMENGVEIARGSFNYYTINKISKNFDAGLDRAKNRLTESYSSNIDTNFLEEVGFEHYFNEKFKKDLQQVSLQTLYTELKAYKSQQKLLFSQAVDQGMSEQQLLEQFPLFNTTTQTLTEFKNTRDNAKRGEYFRNRWGFGGYVKFCDKIFKPVSMEVGKAKAEIRALQDEAIDAQLLQHWAHIVQKGDQYFILLVPKTNMQSVRALLNDLPVPSKDKSWLLHSFNSLTLRALNKLIRRNLGKLQADLGVDAKAIKLYQEVLAGKHRQIQLDLSGFEQEIQQIVEAKFESIEEFRLAFEKVAYHRSEKCITQECIEELQHDHNTLLLEVTSYDIKRDITGEKKEHTRIWQRFWDQDNRQNNFPIRLNPELRIFYRPRKAGNEPQKHRNRFSEDHFGVAFTISQNASGERNDMAFAKEKAVLAMVEKFNQDVVKRFCQDKGESLYYYGIDRGQNELATLCVTRFSSDQYEAMLADGKICKHDTPQFPQIVTYRIKEICLHDKKQITSDRKGTKKEVELYKNPSYFINDQDKFEKVPSPFIDLTTAKLIKGNIVLNGDMQTYIALKKASGKRQLLEKLHKINPAARVEFDEAKGRFQVKSKSNAKDAYQYLPFYPKKLWTVLARDKFRDELQNCLEQLLSDNSTNEDVSIQKINHLRDAITGNMVGIIAFLFERYPGIINLENLHSKDHIDRHFNANNENIARRLEWSLYKKFQKIGLVPPRIRQTIFLRENEVDGKKINQFGIIHFVPPEGTSARCPYCGVSTPIGTRKKPKFESNTYICEENKKCTFSTDNPKPPLSDLKNSDDVAAYNVAKYRNGKQK